MIHIPVQSSFLPKLWAFSFRKSFEWISQCCATLSTFWNGPSRFQFKLVWLFLFSVPVITFKNGDRLTDIPKLHLKMNTEWLTLEIIHQCWKDRAGSREPFGSKNKPNMACSCNLSELARICVNQRIKPWRMHFTMVGSDSGFWL